MDPFAEKFPNFTPYHYVHNNPINLIDPDGRQIYPVHGTWSSRNTWQNMGGILNATKKLFGDSKLGSFFNWSGGNYRKYKSEAAIQLVMDIVNDRKGLDRSEPVTIVGHSHGGNVGILAVNIMSELEEFNDVAINLLTINTLVRSDCQLSEKASSRVNHINVYDEKDPVQNKGRGIIQIGGVRSKIKGTGEIGPAG